MSKKNVPAREASRDPVELALYEAVLEQYAKENGIDTTALPPIDMVRGRCHGLEQLVGASLHVMGRTDVPEVLDQMWVAAQTPPVL